MVIKKEIVIGSLLIIALFMLTSCQGPLGHATTYTAPVIEEIGCFDSAGDSKVYFIDSGVKRGGAILNGFAFTTSIGLRGRGGFRVTDIRDSQLPFKAHILVNETHYGTPGVVITKDLKAYVCGDPYSFELSVLDITNPVKPVELGSGGEGCGKRGLDMQLVGNYAYILNTRGLYIVDVSNPSDPATIGKFEPELQKAEVSEYNPKEGEIIVGMTLNSFVVYGNYVYLGTSDAGLIVFDASNPSDLRVVGNYFRGDYAHPKWDTPVTGYTAAPVTDVAVTGTTAYIIQGGKLQVLDISNPGNPAFIKTYESANTARNLFVRGDKLYVTFINTPTQGGSPSAHYLTVMDITDKTTPLQTVTYDISKVEESDYKGTFISGESMSLERIKKDILDIYWTNIIDIVQGNMYLVAGQILIAITDVPHCNIPEESCGNGVCGLGETSSTCSSDCQVSTAPATCYNQCTKETSFCTFGYSQEHMTQCVRQGNCLVWKGTFCSATGATCMNNACS